MQTDPVKTAKYLLLLGLLLALPSHAHPLWPEFQIAVRVNGLNTPARQYRDDTALLLTGTMPPKPIDEQNNIVSYGTIIAVQQKEIDTLQAQLYNIKFLLKLLAKSDSVDVHRP